MNERLREAAQVVVNGAEPDDDFEGAFMEYLVPATSVDALRAALTEAAPAPDLLAAVERDVMKRIAGLGYKTDGTVEVVARSQVYRVVREAFEAAPASREAGLDAERLALALHAFYAGKDTRDEFFPADCNHREDAAIIAVAYAADDPNAAIAAEYGRLAASPVTEE